VPKEKIYTRKISLVLEPDLYEKIEAAAREKGLTVSAFLRMKIKELFS